MKAQSGWTPMGLAHSLATTAANAAGRDAGVRAAAGDETEAWERPRATTRVR